MPPQERGGGRLALRIDVDFESGLLRAVPFFLDVLREAGMRATFFVVAGSNRQRRLLGRLVRPGYARRLWRLGPLRIASGLGWRSSGAAMLEAPGAHEVLGRILKEGCELAVHGHDHTWWADHAWQAAPDRLLGQIDRAYKAIEAATGRQDLAWGSPGWRTTDEVLWSLQRRGVRYFSECWGRAPFITLDTGRREIPVVHLPITLPSLESLILDRGLDAQEAVTTLVRTHGPGRVDLACFHDYFEGLLHPRLFRLFVEQCTRRGLGTVTLEEAALGVEAARPGLARAALTRAPLPGFAGQVSWQGPEASGRTLRPGESVVEPTVSDLSVFSPST